MEKQAAIIFEPKLVQRAQALGIDVAQHTSYQALCGELVSRLKSAVTLGQTQAATIEQLLTLTAQADEQTPSPRVLANPLQHTIELQRQEINNLQQKLKTLSAIKTFDSSDCNAFLREANQRQVENDAAERAAELEFLRNENDELKTKVYMLNSKLSRLETNDNAQLTERDEKISSLARQLELTQKECSVLHDNMHDAQVKQQDLEKAHEKIRRLTAILEGKNTDLDETREQVKALSAQVGQLQIQLQHQTESLLHNVSASESALQVIEDEMRVFIQRTQTRELQQSTESAELRLQYDSLQKHIETKRSSATHQRAQSDSRKAALIAQRNSVLREIQKSYQRSSLIDPQLKEYLAQLNQELSNLS